MNKPPKLIGITGGIGAGKSTVARVFQVLGVPIYDADSRAKWIMYHSAHLKEQIIQEFGPKTFVNGELDRAYLASQVFDRPERLAILNGLVHPEVAKDFTNWARSQNKPYVLKEAALLFESKSYKELDQIIVVSAPEELRIKRVLLRDVHRSKEDIEHIIARQWPEEEKLERADFVIKNNETELVIPQVNRIHQHLLEHVTR